MADIKITDNVSASADFKIRDDSPLAKAGLTQLVTTGDELVKNFTKPIDQADIKSIALGGTFTSPGFLNSDLLSLTVAVGINGALTIVKPTDKLLFPDDGFSPTIPVSSNHAWLGLEFDLVGKMKVGVSANGVGVSLEGDTKLGCSTFTEFSASVPPLLTLSDAAAKAFGNYSMVTNAAAVRSQSAGTVYCTEASGSVILGVTLSQPFTLNPLASSALPFNITASVQPQVTLKLAPSITVSGDLLVRSYKVSRDVVRLGVYKKRGSNLSATFSASAGIGGDIGSTDVLGMLLNAALPGVDVAAAGISGDNGITLNKVIKDSLNRSLSAQLNATCSAATTDEAAVLYDIHLIDGDSATDDAIAVALHGDWSKLESLQNANRIRNIAVETSERKSSISINLFGFYSATSVTDYLRRCTVLVDESGQVSFIDKADTKRISASTEPFASDANKLRQALMEDFLCTAAYKLLNGRLVLDLSATQSYFDYEREMSRSEMQENVRLGYALGLIPDGSLDAILSANSSFHHACAGVTIRYDMPALLDIFFYDRAKRIARTREELEAIGRNTMSLLLDPRDATDSVRLSILRNDTAWKQMDEIGNVVVFSAIPFLSHLGSTQLGAVIADWVSIAWWAEAISKIAPALSVALDAAESASSNPENDQGFLKARGRLVNILGEVTRKTDAAFVHGWGEAVMFVLSGRHGSAEIDMKWNSQALRFVSPPPK